ncbi:MAG: SHOCT domain-containing protein [Lachnospiraceae bacterium]|nr:SHOCT domain-containing protein [Lachnospiraceae bacterium]
MSWYDDMFEQEIDSYYAERKEGLFGKKTKVKLIVYPKHLEATVFPVYDDTIQKESDMLSIDYSEVKDVYEGEIDGEMGIIIEYIISSSVIANNIKRVIVLGIPEQEKWVELIRATKGSLDEEKRENEIKGKLLSEKKEKDALSFYTSCYEFHISENTPYYELFREKNRLAVIYVGKDKSLNFLGIDGYSREESNEIISYEKIHYYEKAGNIHYVADIHGSHSSYGGSFTGATVSTSAVIWGALLFGKLGMVYGALRSYKPAEMKGASAHYEFQSETKEIDKRSVVLNFYSDIKKQYIDIELPADIYNFLQTYLPEKRYNIVLELEKKAAVQNNLKQIEGGEVLQAAADNTQKEIADSQMEEFKIKVEKLKMMLDTGLLTEEEFKMERAKLLEML